jgi:hypothetical protein
MNIAITLPKNLWDKICSGEKLYECRKQIPRNFLPGCDSVWVILKGTNKVVGFFKIDTFLTDVPVKEVAESYLDEICVEKTWLEQYAKQDDVLQLWRIQPVVYLAAIQQDREKFLGLSFNPQGYAYCQPVIEEHHRCFKRGRAFRQQR